MALRRDEQHDRSTDDSVEWQRHAACRGEHTAAFFPPHHFEPKQQRLARERRAKAVCRRCPVADDCLAHALATREPHGVWGGLTEIERRDLLAGRVNDDDGTAAARGRGR